MASFSNMTDIDLDRQIASLSKELAALKKAASKRGATYYEDGRDAAWETYSDLAGRIGDSLPSLRKRARAIEDSARDHPATAAAVGLVVVGLVAAMLFSRR
jgi:ElaB/YqjD/DUF883 family membrane-anchored ribosome-binding protein